MFVVIDEDVAIVFVVALDVAADALSNFDGLEEDELLHVVDAVEVIVVLALGAKSVVRNLPRMSTTSRLLSERFFNCHRLRVGLRGAWAALMPEWSLHRVRLLPRLGPLWWCVKGGAAFPSQLKGTVFQTTCSSLRPPPK
jgi:hypothetical protein